MGFCVWTHNKRTSFIERSELNLKRKMTLGSIILVERTNKTFNVHNKVIVDKGSLVGFHYFVFDGQRVSR